MKRLDFLKRSALLSGILFLGKSSTSKTFGKTNDSELKDTEKVESVKTEYKFDELFYVHKGNDILIYPKKDSIFYKNLLECVKDRVDLKKSFCYVPKRDMFIEVKDTYTLSDFKHIELYLTSYYMKNTFFTSEWGNGEVFFRFIRKDGDRMYFEYFQGDKRG